MKQKPIYVCVLIFSLAIFLQHSYANPFHPHAYLPGTTISNDSLVLVIQQSRGAIQWEKSSDCENWVEISSALSDTLHIGNDSLAFYRAKITEGTCLPVYSDTILISDLSNKRVFPARGDTLKIRNLKNELITLIIPPYALQDTTIITMIPYLSAPESPIAKSIFDGVRLLPDKLRLLKPATLRVEGLNETCDSSMSTLCYLSDSSLISPLANPEISIHSIQGDIFHFSSYIGGEPNADEMKSQSDKTKNSASTNPFDWQSTYTVLDGLIWIAESLIFTGHSEDAQKVIEKANTIIKNDAKKFLKEKIPEQPCGWYLQVLFRFAEKVNLLVGDELNQQFSDRIQELMDLCQFRGEVEYDHQITFSLESYEYTWDITGFVPFSVSTQDYTTISGSGIVDHAISGQAGDCEITGFGSIKDTIRGELVADHVGFPWLEMTFHETMFEGYGVTYVCPEYTYESPQPVGHSEPSVRFMMENGWKVMIPVIAPGASGSYVYILHLIHLPQ